MLDENNEQLLNMNLDAENQSKIIQKKNHLEQKITTL
jgi:hypothetical protein